MTEFYANQDDAPDSSRDDAIETYRQRVEAQREQSQARRVDPDDPDATLADRIRILAREKDTGRRTRRGNLSYRSNSLRLERAKGHGPVYAGMAALATAIVIGTPALTNATYGEERAKQYVEQMGFEDVTHVDTDWFFVGWQGCSDTDSVGYNFEAVADHDDEVVQLLVCKGLLKGATLREG